MTGDGMLDFDVESVGPFQMESWSSTQRAWSVMHSGPAKNVWRPRATLEEAVEKCLEWTGNGCIPGMRVIDQSTGDVVWQGSDRYPEAGPEMLLPNEEEVRERVRERLHAMP